jgi:hypothetical protein
MCERASVGDANCPGGRFTGVKAVRTSYPLTTRNGWLSDQADIGCATLAFGLGVGLPECASRTLAACLVHAIDVDPYQAQLTGVELTKVRLKLWAKDHVDINLRKTTSEVNMWTGVT